MKSAVLLKKIKRAFSGYFNQLTLFLLLLFVFRPYDWNATSIAIWETFFSGVFFSAIFNANHPRPIKILTIILGIPALLLDWVSLFYPYKYFIIFSLLFTIAFLFVCTASILYNVVLRVRVTLETLRAVICAYFMIAFAFGFLYLLIEFWAHGSFHLISLDKINSYNLHTSHLSQFLYFSFVVLLAIGFGDITPLTDLSQSFVVLEGLTGQFYMAMVVARIVSVYVLFGDKSMMKHLEKDIKNVSEKIQSK
jgi:voltage-gated potassium channel